MSSVCRTFAILVAVSACAGCTRVAEPPAPSPPPNVEPAAPPAPAPPPETGPAAVVRPAMLARMPHDPAAFTQGLLFAGDAFLESTGMYGQSTLRRVDPATGRVLASVQLPPTVFAEGLARLHGELFQLTWREHTCFVYDEATLAKRRELSYDGEGWGLTTDGGALLVMSDGSADLRFLDPATLHEVRRVTVRDAGRPLTQLNELEWVHGEILANVWMTRLVARIDPATGEVRGMLDLSALPEPAHDDDPDAVLNGIAFDERRGRLFVTGKRWHSVFEIAPPEAMRSPAPPP